MIRFKLMDCGAQIGVGLRIGGWSWARRFRNPFFRWDERKGGVRRG